MVPMKKALIAGLALASFVLYLGFTTQNVSASTAYRTVTTKSYAKSTPTYHAKNATKSVYMWNSTLTKKLHNLKNYPRTTWYVKKSVKLTNGKKTGIFYYIQNKSNSVSGYVWRNYLIKGAYKSSATPTRASLSEAEIVKQVMTVLPGTVYDASLQKIADSNIAHDGDVYANMQEALPKNEQSNFAMLGFDYFDNATLLSELKAGKISYAAYSKQLLTENLTAQLKDKGQVFYSLIKGKTINDFSGWHIAVSAYPSTSKYFGSALVLLLKPTA